MFTLGMDELLVETIEELRNSLPPHKKSLIEQEIRSDVILMIVQQRMISLKT